MSRYETSVEYKFVFGLCVALIGGNQLIHKKHLLEGENIIKADVK